MTSLLPVWRRDAKKLDTTSCYLDWTNAILLAVLSTQVAINIEDFIHPWDIRVLWLWFCWWTLRNFSVTANLYPDCIQQGVGAIT